jgi:hypothetical protein
MQRLPSYWKDHYSYWKSCVAHDWSASFSWLAASMLHSFLFKHALACGEGVTDNSSSEYVQLKCTHTMTKDMLRQQAPALLMVNIAQQSIAALPHGGHTA